MRVVAGCCRQLAGLGTNRHLRPVDRRAFVRCGQASTRPSGVPRLSGQSEQLRVGRPPRDGWVGSGKRAPGFATSYGLQTIIEQGISLLSKLGARMRMIDTVETDLLNQFAARETLDNPTEAVYLRIWKRKGQSEAFSRGGGHNPPKLE